MSKSSKFNSPKVLLPTLAVAVLGMAAMIGVTANLQKTLDPASQASANKCVSISHPLDKDFVSRHFYSKVGVGSVSGKQDNDLMEIEQPAGSNAGTRVTYDKLAKGDFTTEVMVRDIKMAPNKDAGQVAFDFASKDGMNVAQVGIRKFGNGNSAIFTYNSLNGSPVTKWTPVKKFNYPITLIIERKADRLSYSAKENNKNKEMLQETSAPTTEDVEIRVAAQTRFGYPKVNATLSNFVLRCN